MLELSQGWTLSGKQVAELPATVPGCVHTDLLAAGLIPGPTALTTPPVLRCVNDIRKHQ